MSFYNEITSYKDFDFNKYLSEVTDEQIQRILQQENIRELDFLALLSPVAEKHMEAMAQKAHQLSIRNFGKTIVLFTPMYLANYCTNQCAYCGFNTTNHIPRHQLTLPEVEAEAQAIAATGLRHILILTGDAKKISSVEYMIDCVKILKKYFHSIGIEVYSLELEEYQALVEAGVDCFTMFQETYNEELYDIVHIKGPKKNYRFRLDAPERACMASMHSVNIGALLGLDEWRKEVFFTGLHGYYLQNHYPGTDISISTPRIQPHTGDFQSSYTVSDRDIVQMMTAYRLFMPRVGLTISTREKPEFRDNLIPLGITKMSAASSTAVGGHTHQEENPGQFDISDPRDVAQMQAAILSRGYQPVFTDWQLI